MQGIFNDITGQKFGHWTVLSLIGRIKKKTYWLCECVCGAKKRVQYYHLSSGASMSCKCQQDYSAVTKHGEALKTKEWLCWKGLKERCLDPNNINYKNYGGRGICVYPEWINSYESFLDYIGRAPSKDYSIDRINNNGNYEPGNVKWSTRDEQIENRRNTIFLMTGGKLMSLSKASKMLDIKHDALRRYFLKSLFQKSFSTRAI